MKKIKFLSFVMGIVMMIVCLAVPQKSGTVNAEENTASVTYQVHSQSYGWMNEVSDGAKAGTEGESKRLEAIKIKLNSSYAGSVSYEVHCQTYGWMNAVVDGAKAGTEGEAKRLEAIKINLQGEIADYYDIYYRVHVQTYGWQDWVKNGEVAGTSGKSKRLEAIEIKLVKKTDTKEINITASAHVQSYGWKNYSGLKFTLGTVGQGKRVEAIKINALSEVYSGGIEYQGMVQSYGWDSSWKKDGQISGTEGEAKRLEAVKIRLTGELADKYDIYYRAHVQTYGWLGWTKNGEPCGTKNYALRMEAIDICVVQKGTEPYKVGNAYKEAATVGDAKMDLYTTRVISQVTNSSMTRGQKLRACYNWCVKGSYVPIVENVPAGYTKEQWYASLFFENYRGNCFAYSSAFCQMAKKLGYNATEVFGYLIYTSGEHRPHGWVTIDGKVYDPQLEWRRGVDCFGKTNFRYSLN